MQKSSARAYSRYTLDALDQLTRCLTAAPNFLLSSDKAKTIIANQINIIQQRFQSVCDEAELPEIDRRLMWRRQFLNPFAFYGAPEELALAGR
jgi:serine/threonine-protein kinase HipA